jgi:hypothetical protein
MDKNDPPPSRAFDPPEEAVWHRMISEAAYYRAQKAEFAEETALEHWLAAEGEIRGFLAGVSTGAISLPAPPKPEPEPEKTLPITGRVAEGGTSPPL